MSSHYEDDPVGIPPGSFLIRSISSQWVKWENGDDQGRPRVTSEAVQFYDLKRATRVDCPSPALSVIIQHLADSLDVLAKRYHPNGLARISADSIRAGDSCGIQLWKTEKEPAHAVVFRLDDSPKLPKSTRRQWAGELTMGWLVLPPKPSA